ncbi:plastocyanin/azurin family copper-binding protein [Sporosarcina aquimarina]|uniref:Plastocyanin/azurin family copper-binding protein n=2 Tax=Sporosarcina aquimarina TaxID=114975 RepID=A0ABU4G2C3_9BACL|nr:plastocyanin/azurin family copper-binding protein [Sporosarcina aquimarina]
MVETVLIGMLAALTLVILILAKLRKSKFGPMQGMVVSMYFGMNIGLTAGVLYGILYQGELFFSTMIAMTIGVMAGTLCGLCFGMLSMLEGIMAGLMGGMMGAMLGEMIQPNEANSFIQLFFLLSVSTIFIMIIVTSRKDAQVQQKKWILKPLTLFVCSVVYLVVANSLVMKSDSLVQLTQNQDPQNLVDSDRFDQQIMVVTKEMRYSLRDIQVEKNTPVALTLNNLDAIEHDIEVRTDAYMQLGKAHQHHGASNKWLHLHTAPNAQESLRFEFKESGIYEFYCTIPGHKEQGMKGQFIVS